MCGGGRASRGHGALQLYSGCTVFCDKICSHPATPRGSRPPPRYTRPRLRVVCSQPASTQTVSLRALCSHVVYRVAMLPLNRILRSYGLAAVPPRSDYWDYPLHGTYSVSLRSLRSILCAVWSGCYSNSNEPEFCGADCESVCHLLPFWNRAKARRTARYQTVLLRGQYIVG